MSVTKQDVHRLQAQLFEAREEIERLKARPAPGKTVETIEKVIRRPTLDQEAENAALRAENDRLRRELAAK